MTNTPKLAIAIGYIDDDLVTGAVEYEPARNKHKSAWFRRIMVAACLCLAFLGVVRLLPEMSTSEPVYTVFAEVVEIQTNGRYEVRITGEDQNFGEGDTAIFNYDYVNSDMKMVELKIGDVIAITYSVFEKTDTTYEITSGQINIVQTSAE